MPWARARESTQVTCQLSTSERARARARAGGRVRERRDSPALRRPGSGTLSCVHPDTEHPAGCGEGDRGFAPCAARFLWGLPLTLSLYAPALLNARLQPKTGIAGGGLTLRLRGQTYGQRKVGSAAIETRDRLPARHQTGFEPGSAQYDLGSSFVPLSSPTRLA